MARPTKWRKIEHIPAIPYFVPSETDVEELPENILKLEELEAIRLKDLEGLEQENVQSAWKCQDLPSSVYFYPPERKSQIV